jgi:glycosyltransferase involved in cell wall biosynthesis
MIDGKWTQHRKMNILAVMPDNGACGWLRVRQNFRALTRNNLANCVIAENIQEAIAYAENADAIICRTSSGYPFIKTLQEVEEKTGIHKRLIFDLDDNLWEINPWSEHYRSLGTKEVKYGEDRWMWRNGYDGFNVQDNKNRLSTIAKMCTLADTMTSASVNMSKFYEQFNDNSKYVKNTIDFTELPKGSVKTDKDSGEVRIVWQGGLSHFEDIHSVAPSIARVLRNNKNVSYYSYGSWWKEGFEKVLGQCKPHSWVNFELLPYKLMFAQPDIAIIPLEDNEFNRMKAGSKFNDYSALGIPSVVRRIEPYLNELEDGYNVLMYDSHKELEQQLERLIKDKALRKKIGSNAYDFVYENYNVDKYANELFNIWMPLI